jgi:hypothetical protein
VFDVSLGKLLGYMVSF